MKTTKKEIPTNLSEAQEKAIALMQHNNEDFFIIEIDGAQRVFEGNEKDARKSYKPAKKDFKTFEEFVQAECIEVADIDGDEEVNGYIVLTDEEADEKAKEYILDTVWAFNASFLSDVTQIDEEAFKAIQENGRCESNNKAILSMINDEDDFVYQAISADGRGHFMNSYDGCENEETVNGTTYYIYRMN